MIDSFFEGKGRVLERSPGSTFEPNEKIKGNEILEAIERPGIGASDNRPLMAFAGKEALTEPTQALKEQLSEKWGQEITDAIGSIEETTIYETAGLEPATVAGRPCLIRTDIDYEQIDPQSGLTNLQRMEQGKPPLDKNGKPIELHHIGQQGDGPLAELTGDEHRKNGNYSVLHPNRQSDVDHGRKWQDEKAEHWRARAEDVKGNT